MSMRYYGDRIFYLSKIDIAPVSASLNKSFRVRVWNSVWALVRLTVEDTVTVRVVLNYF